MANTNENCLVMTETHARQQLFKSGYMATLQPYYHKLKVLHAAAKFAQLEAIAGVGKHILWRATFKTSSLSGAAYII